MSEQSPLRRNFDLTVNLGHVIIIVTGVAAFVGSYYVSEHRQSSLERQVTTIEAKLDRFTTVLIDAAVTAQKIREIERRLDLAERPR